MPLILYMKGETEGEPWEKHAWLPLRTSFLLCQRRQKLPSKNLAKFKTSALNWRSEVINASTSKILPSKAANYDKLIHLVSYVKNSPLKTTCFMSLYTYSSNHSGWWHHDSSKKQWRPMGSESPNLLAKVYNCVGWDCFVAKLYLVYQVPYFLSSFLTSK